MAIWSRAYILLATLLSFLVSLPALKAEAQVSEAPYVTNVFFPQVAVSSAKMINSHTLEVGIFLNVYGGPGSVSISANINGKDVVVPNNTLPRGINFVTIDLAQQQVPRFTSNQRFTITAHLDTGGGKTLDATHDVIVLLPVVIVPGINPLAFYDGNIYGGDGTFPQLETFLRQESQNYIASKNAFGDGYSLIKDAPNYPTLNTLEYDRNNATLSEGASALATLIANIKSATYAAVVNIVTHSKGGLVARRYVVDDQQLTVRHLIMTAPPNAGAVLAETYGAKIEGYMNLRPVWKWFRSTAKLNRKFADVSFNPELRLLNNIPVPQNVLYTILYSNSLNTDAALTNDSHEIVSLPGDSIVTALSALGRIQDMNPGAPIGPQVLAFKNAPIEFVIVAGTHVNYIQIGEVMNQVIFRLLETQ